MMKTHHSHSYPLLSALLFFFFVTWSSSGSLLSIWLHQEVGLKAGDTGVIYAVLSVSALCAQICYGFIQDKLGLRKNLLWFLTSLLILSGPAFLLFGYLLQINVLLGSIFGGIYIGLTFNGGIGVLESYTERVARQSQFEFGKARMWGSLGWAVASSFSGLLFNLSPAYNFILGSVASVVMLIVLLSLKVNTNSAHAGEVLTKEKIAPSDVYALLRNRKFWAFCLYVAGVAWMMFIAEQQFSRYFVTFFDDIHQGNAVFGYLGTVQSGMEFVMYMVIPLFVNFIGAKRGLLIVGLVVGARLIISGMCDSHLLISVLKPLYGLEICLLLVSVFKYIAEHFDKRVNATMYLLGYQAMLYVGNVVVSSPAGYMYDRIGFEQTYIIMGATALTFTLISAFTLSACQSKWRGARALNVAETSTR